MTQTITMPVKLPSLNEVVAANRRNKYAGAKLKHDAEDLIKAYIRAARFKPVTEPCIVHIVFHEPYKKRDVDNVESAKKFILDALVDSGVLAGDSPKHVIAAPSFVEYGKPQHAISITIISGKRADLVQLIRMASDTIAGGAHV